VTRSVSFEGKVIAVTAVVTDLIALVVISVAVAGFMVSAQDKRSG
jgi:hypothetical protein